MSSQSMSAVAAVTVTLAAETAILTSVAVPENQPTGEGVQVSGTVIITPGAGTTAVTVRVRAGVGTGGTVIGPAAGFPLPVTAGVATTLGFDALDTTTQNLSPGIQYTVTVQQTGATANGTVAYATCVSAPCTASVG